MSRNRKRNPQILLIYGTEKKKSNIWLKDFTWLVRDNLKSILSFKSKFVLSCITFKTNLNRVDRTKIKKRLT